MSEAKKNDSRLRLWANDFRALWESLPYKSVFGVLLLVWMALFHFLGNSVLGYVQTNSLFGWMHYVFTTSSEDEHCMLIPLVVAGLFWWKRRELLAVEKRIWWPAIILVALGLAVHIAGYLVQQTRVSIVGFFVGLYGLTGLVWGMGWLRATFFPFFLFGFCVPLGGVSDGITFPLRLMVTQISAGVSHYVLGIDVIRNGSMLFDSAGSYQYDVAPACSGIRSLISLTALTTIYGFMTFQSNWKRALMVVVSVPLAVVGNSVRIIGVIIAAEAFGQNAGAMIEQKLGFVTFAVALAGVLALGYWLRERREEAVIEGQTA